MTSRMALTLFPGKTGREVPGEKQARSAVLFMESRMALTLFPGKTVQARQEVPGASWKAGAVGADELSTSWSPASAIIISIRAYDDDEQVDRHGHTP